MQRNHLRHHDGVSGDEDSVMSDPDNDPSPRERIDSVAAWLQTPQRFRLANQYRVWNDQQLRTRLDEIDYLQTSRASNVSTNTPTADIILTGRHISNLQPPRPRSRAQNIPSNPPYDVTRASTDIPTTRVVTQAQMLQETIATAQIMTQAAHQIHINEVLRVAVAKKPNTKPFWHTTNTIAQAPGLTGNDWRRAVPRQIEGPHGPEDDVGCFPARRKLNKWVIAQARRQGGEGARRLGSLFPEAMEGEEGDKTDVEDVSKGE